MGNAGQVAPRELVDAFDSIVTFEQPMRNYEVDPCPGGYAQDTLYCGMSWHPVLDQQVADLSNGSLRQVWSRNP